MYVDVLMVISTTMEYVREYTIAMEFLPTIVQSAMDMVIVSEPTVVNVIMDLMVETVQLHNVHKDV